MTSDSATPTSAPNPLVLWVGVAVALGIRIALLPRPGLAGDAIDFLAWARFIGSAGLGRAYDQPISFPPVMPWVWWATGTLAPGFLNPAPNDPIALALLKLPAVAADLGIAAIVGWHLRPRPGWAVAGMVGLLLVPATWYVSALWAQFESLYVLPMLVGWALLVRGRPGWAAVAIAVTLMTKPQALPMVVPLAAYYVRTVGFRGSVRGVAIAAATAIVLWTPFVAAGGPANYVGSLAAYSDQFAVLSLRAWNPWWVLQELGAGGQLVADTVPLIGPVTLRWVGIAAFSLLELAVFWWVWRRPTATGLAWGLAAAALSAFIALTTMHERYAYPALIFLVLAWPNRLAVGAWLVLAVTISLNLVAAVPPTGGPGTWVPIGGVVGIVGAAAMTATIVMSFAGLRVAGAGPDGAPLEPARENREP